MKLLTIFLTLILCMTTGCRCAFYGALGPQSLDEVEVRLTNVKPDPNMAEIGTMLGVAVKEVLK